MSIGPPIPEIQHFKNLTLKIQGQGHGWDGHWKSQHGSNILSTHIPWIPCQSTIPFLRYDFFKIWSWKSKVNVMGEGCERWKSQSGCNILSTHIIYVPCQSALPFLRYRIFKIWLENPRSSSDDHDVAQPQVYTITLNFKWNNSIQWSGSSAAWFDKFLAHGQARMGHMGK